MKKLSFFDVPAEYVNFLRKHEMDIRGFSRVPLVDYEMHNRKGKFFCGIVLHINDYCYHVPVSSKIQEHSNTFFLYDRGLRIGSLRFDYMIPVPERVMEIRIVENERDIPYRRLMEKELAYCRAHTSEIREMALRTYMMVTLTGQRTEHLRLERSCDFRLLEGACDIYVLYVLRFDASRKCMICGSETNIIKIKGKAICEKCLSAAEMNVKEKEECNF